MFLDGIMNPMISAIQESLRDRIIQEKPRLVIAPENAADVQQLLRLAKKHAFRIMILGSGSSFPPDVPIPKDAVALIMSKLETPWEWDEENLTVTVAAGIRIADFISALESRGWEYRFLQESSRITIGGALASGHDSNQAFSHRKIMGFLLGLEAIHADGEIAKWGGKMVKNVAGLDVASLYFGSSGTLAVIVECTFRLVPFPSPLFDAQNHGRIQAEGMKTAAISANDYLQQLHKIFDPQGIFYQPTCDLPRLSAGENRPVI
jgi:glycolate oxidase